MDIAQFDLMRVLDYLDDAEQQIVLKACAFGVGVNIADVGCDRGFVFFKPFNPLDKIIQAESEKHNEGWAEEVWRTIIANDGSVQHLDWMDDWTKDVFKTSMEIDQRWVVQHAADRQVYVDQAQSLNVFFRPDSHIKYIHAVHFMAWKLGLKTMYYCRSDKIAKADKVAKKIEREVIKEIDLHAMTGDESVCLACEG